MNRNDGSLHHNRNQRENKFFRPTTKSRGSAFPTKPFRSRFLFKASRGVDMQTVPGLQRGAQSQHLPWDHSCFSPPLHALCESRRDPNMWEVESQRVRARGTGTPAALLLPCRAERLLVPLPLVASPSFSLALLPASTNPSEETQPDPQAFSNNSVGHLYIKRKKPVHKEGLWAETRPAPLRQHRPFDDPPLLVDGEVVVARVVQALLDPRVQVLWSDERFGFLLNEGEVLALNAR